MVFFRMFENFDFWHNGQIFVEREENTVTKSQKQVGRFIVGHHHY